jgi:hypothetical protein
MILTFGAKVKRPAPGNQIPYILLGDYTAKVNRVKLVF